MNLQHRAIFFDRDGVVNQRLHGDYVKTIGEFRFLSDIFQVLPAAHAAGYLTVVITNQRGIGRGVMDENALADVHQYMQTELKRQTGQVFDAIYHCPHNSNDNCPCRKPMPGMLLQAADELGIDLAKSWMIGDAETDIEAGLTAGCRTVRIGGPDTETKATYTALTLASGWQIIAGSL